MYAYSAVGWIRVSQRGTTAANLTVEEASVLPLIRQVGREVVESLAPRRKVEGEVVSRLGGGSGCGGNRFELTHRGTLKSEAPIGGLTTT